MTISLQYCNITVNDVDEAIAFYTGAMGFELRADRFRVVRFFSWLQAQLWADWFLKIGSYTCSEKRLRSTNKATVVRVAFQLLSTE